MRSERSTDASRTLNARARELEGDSHRDPLTGLPNSTWFDVQLAHLFGEVHEARSPLTLMLVDVDGLQAINQQHGHGAGEKVIISVAACLRSKLRPRDLVARHGAAAFCILLPRAPAAAGRVVAERLRAGVADAGHDVASAHTLRVTISIGCVTLERGGCAGFVTRQEVVDSAARALGSAKRDGGNKIVFLVDKAGESLDRPPSAV